MARKLYDFDLIVIGSGIAGTVAARLASATGKKTAIIEEDELGGECSNWGCIPSKTLLNVAHTLDQAKRADKFGLRTSTISYNYPSIRAWKDKVVQSLGLDNDNISPRGNIKIINGHAGFVGPHEITTGSRHYTSENFLIATGSRMIWPDIDGLNRVKYLTHREAVNLPRAPKSIAIIGGGATGVEFAELFAIFGSKVYLIEQYSHLLPDEDPAVGELLADIFQRDRSMTVLTGTRVSKIRQTGATKEVFYDKNNASIKVDTIMVAAGKVPNANLGLENVGVKYGISGIEVNAYQQTSSKNIFAAGDCTGVQYSTPQSSMQSRVAVHNMFHRNAIEIPKGPIPRIIFTTPEVASIGLTPKAAETQGYHTKTVDAKASSIPRAHIDKSIDGFARLTVDIKSGRLLGASLVCPNASEIIHELSIVMHSKMPVSKLQHIYHAFPTWSELIQVAANKL